MMTPPSHSAAPSPGSTVGPYVVERELGRGGMGVVFLAKDSRLDRLVAIKALPPALAGDPDRLARFEREAKVLASLNHPGVAAIHGLEESAGHRYLVLEFVEGETLADRLARGPIPVDEALPLARQIAEALEAAHEKGVIHRDLKPGNIMVTPEGAAKVLDFGLARAGNESASTSIGPGASPISPTITSPAVVHSPTIPGAIMGTAGYMSPEQARGKPIDKRSDIFSFGCVLYEMLSGRQPFPGETVTDAIGALLHREPDWSLLPADAPTRLRELLASCLIKDRKNRLHDIADARLAIERAGQEAPSVAVEHRRPVRERVAWGLVVLAACAVVVAWSTRGSGSGSGVARPVRFAVPAPPGLSISPESVDCAISPDGQRLAFIARVGSEPGRLWLRDLQDLVARPLEGTESARLPFWSPDSRAIGFFIDGAVCRVDAAGGPVQRLADAPGGRGGAWSETGVILFAPLANGPFHVVPQSGGASTQALGLNAAEDETGHRFPQFLPGGKRFIYTSMGAGRTASDERTFIATLGEKEGRLVTFAEDRATFAEPDWLLFKRSGMLYAQKIHPDTGVLSGEAVATGILPGGASNYGGRYSVTVSRNGTVACPIDAIVKTQLVEFGPDGKPVRTLASPPAEHDSPRVTLAGDRLVVLAGVSSAKTEIRLIDLVRDGVWSRGPDETRGYSPFWSPDGKTLYYSADRKSRDIFRWDTGGAAAPELLLESGNLWVHPRDLSSDGRSLVYNLLDPKNARDLHVLDLVSKSSRPIAAGPANEYDARFSPDGKLVALAIEEQSRAELFVQSFPEPAGRVRVSIEGLGAVDTGQRAVAAIRWSRDGSTLFFLDSDKRTIKSAAITVRESGIEVGKPATVAQLPPGIEQIEIGPDGKTFFGAVQAPGQQSCSIVVSLNWPGLLPGQ